MNVDLSAYLKQRAVNDRQVSGDARSAAGNFTDFFEKAETKVQSDNSNDRKENLAKKSESAERHAKRHSDKADNKATKYNSGKSKEHLKSVSKNSNGYKPNNGVSEETTEENTVSQTGEVADKDRVTAHTEESVAENDSLDAAEEKLLKKLAEILQMPVDELRQILAALNLTPADLTNKVNLNLLMQKVFDVSQVSQLLNVENISQIYRDVEKALEEFAETALKDLTQALQAKESAETAAQTSQTQEMPVKTEVSVNANPIVENKVANTDVSDKPVVSQEATLPENPAPAVGHNSQSGGHTGNESGNSGNESNTGIPVTETQNTNAAPMTLNQTAEKAFAEHLEKAKLPFDVEPKEILNQIHDKIKVDVRGSLSEIRVNLKPEQLGDVTLKIATQNGIITAQFVAENQRVKEIIESNFNQLKDVLKEQGIEIHNLSVSVGQDKANEQANEFKRNAQAFDRRNSVKSAQSVEIPEEAVAEIAQDSSVNYLA